MTTLALLAPSLKNEQLYCICTQLRQQSRLYCLAKVDSQSSRRITLILNQSMYHLYRQARKLCVKTPSLDVEKAKRNETMKQRLRSTLLHKDPSQEQVMTLDVVLFDGILLKSFSHILTSFFGRTGKYIVNHLSRLNTKMKITGCQQRLIINISRSQQPDIFLKYLSIVKEVKYQPLFAI